MRIREGIKGKFNPPVEGGWKEGSEDGSEEVLKQRAQYTPGLVLSGNGDEDVRKSRRCGGAQVSGEANGEGEDEYKDGKEEKG